ncbi:MAG: tetratricopeptide repeat protein [Candidatus Margulisiibacteriota bacterium]
MRLKITLTTLILAALLTSTATATIEAREAFKNGYTLLEEGNYFSSINSFKLALKDPSFPLLDYSYFYIAKAYQKTNHPDNALLVYKIVLDYYQDSVLIPETLFQVAQIKLDANNYSEAEASLRGFISRFPDHEYTPKARYLLGTLLEKEKKYVDAVRVYRNLDLLHPNSDWAEKGLERVDVLAKKTHLADYEASAATVYNLGIKQFKKKNYSKAKEYFTRLTKFYKKSSFYDEAVIMMGRLYLRKGNLKTAAKYFKQVINLNKDSKPEAMYYLALTYWYMDNPDAAIKTLEKTVVMYPKSSWADDALYYLGRYYKLEDDTQKALKAYEKLVADYPNSENFADSLWIIGNLYYKQGKYESAYDNFTRALDLPAEKVTDQLIFWAAKSAEKIGRKDKAVAAYKATISKYDHSYYGYRAREELKKYGINIKSNTVPEIQVSIADLGKTSAEFFRHEQKYEELLALGLGDEAAAEASFLEEKVPTANKEKVQLAKYHAYVMKGKFAKPIWFADQKIQEATLSGSLSDLDPRLWRFSYPRGYWQYVEKYSKKYGLDPYLTYAVIREESRFKSRALSRSYAHGLMQIIPSTGRLISRALGMSYSRWKMYDPRANIWMGTYYLSTLIKRFDGNVSLALAGYNGGPVRVEKWRKKYKNLDIDEFVEDIPITETRNYVKKVLKSYYGYKRTYSSDR